MTSWQHCDIVINSALRVRCGADWRLDRAWSERLEDCDLWYVWSGQGQMQLHDQTIDLRPGSAIWARPGGLYLADHDPTRPLGVSAIHFDLVHRRSRRRYRDDRLPGEVWQAMDVSYVEAVMRRISALHHASRMSQTDADGRADESRAAATLLKGLLIDLTTSSERTMGDQAKPTEQQRAIYALAAEVRAAPQEFSSVKTMARRVYLSVDHFSRLFQHVTGQRPGQFLIDARTDHARQLLRESSQSVGKIAEVLGYRDIYFFSRQFKQQTGLSPTQYRAGEEHDG